MPAQTASPLHSRFSQRHLLRGIVLAATLGVAACSFPGVYKLDIQQGNIVTQEMVNQLKPGMSKRQVRYIMGTPMLVDSFNENRWDYFYSLRNSRSEYSQERLTLVFVNDQLQQLQGNFHPDSKAGSELDDDLALPSVPVASKAATANPSPLPKDSGAVAVPAPQPATPTVVK